MKKLISTLLFLNVAIATQLPAQATLSIQGVIKNSDGTAVENGKYSLTFSLYTTASGGPTVWTETQDDLSVTGGIYSALLGETVALTAAFDQSYYLGVKVDGAQELVPRARLTSAPYALSLIGVNNTFPSSGTIGAGTVTPNSDYLFHAKHPSGTGKVLVEGSSGAVIDLKNGANTTSINYDGSKIIIPDMMVTNLTATNLTATNLTLNSDLELPQGKTINYDGLKDWRLVERNDFEANQEGWLAYASANSNSIVSSELATFGSAYLNRKMVRPFQSNDAVLKKNFPLSGIPHNYVKVVFTYHMIDSWDVNQDFAWAGFDNDLSGKPDLVWGSQAVGWYADLDDYGSSTTGNPNDNDADISVRAEMVLKTTVSFYAVIGAHLNGDYLDESYGISNVEVWVR